MHRKSIGVLATIVLASATPALAESADKLGSSISGRSAGAAEDALQSRGFKYIDSNTNSMGYTYSHWWKSADRTCVQVEAHRNQVLTVNDAPARDCGHTEKGSNAGAAVGVVAGAAILGALLSHKSHHHDDDKHLSSHEAELQYERGYADGLHNAPYHNYDKAEQYSAGYTAGVDERSANLRHHHGRGGYAAAVGFSDLQGARAAGAMSELESRGFRQVDNFTSGSGRYSIQWRPASRQCLQVITADGHIEDIRDIGSHPSCK